MAAKKKTRPATGVRKLCGHSSSHTCSSCGTCGLCFDKSTTEIATLRQQVSKVTNALGQAATREEQLKQYIASPYNRPDERTERDLAIARIVLLRRRIEDAIRRSCAPVPEQHAIPDIPPKPFDLKAAIEEVLRMDDLTRTRSIEEVVAEATALPKPPPKPRATDRQGSHEGGGA